MVVTELAKLSSARSEFEATRAGNLSTSCRSMVLISGPQEGLFVAFKQLSFLFRWMMFLCVVWPIKVCLDDISVRSLFPQMRLYSGVFPRAMYRWEKSIYSSYFILQQPGVE